MASDGDVALSVPKKKVKPTAKRANPAVEITNAPAESLKPTEEVSPTVGARRTLSELLPILAGLSSLTLLMGFPAVALQFRGFGVPLDFAPQRSFLLAGVLPTLILIFAMFASTRPISSAADQGEAESSRKDGAPVATWLAIRHSPQTFLIGWPPLLAAILLMAVAQVWIVGGWCQSLLPLHGAHPTWRVILGALPTAAIWAAPVVLRKHRRMAWFGGVFGLSGIAIVLLKGGGFLDPLLIVAPLAPYPLVWVLGKTSSRWGAKWAEALPARDLEGVVGAIPMLVPLFTSVLMNFGMAFLFADGARASLVVLHVLSSSAPRGPWLMAGFVLALVTNHGMVVFLGRWLAGQRTVVSVWAAMVGKASSLPNAALGRGLARGAHVILVVSLTLVHVLGAYTLIPRTFLGGRPVCVAGAAEVQPLSRAHPIAAGYRADGTRFEFDHLCVLVSTADDVVLCEADRPPARCLILKRDDVSSLVTFAAAGTQGRDEADAVFQSPAPSR